MQLRCEPDLGRGVVKTSSFSLVQAEQEQSQRPFSKSVVRLCGCIFTTKQRKLYAFLYEFYDLYKFFLKRAGSLFIHVIT